VRKTRKRNENKREQPKKTGTTDDREKFDADISSNGIITNDYLY